MLKELSILITIFEKADGLGTSKSRMFYCTLLSPVHIYFCYFRWPFFLRTQFALYNVLQKREKKSDTKSTKRNEGMVNF